MCATNLLPRFWGPATLVALLIGCARNTAPNGWLPDPRAAGASAYGGWIELEYVEGKQSRFVDGELIAVTADSVWVLGRRTRAVVPFPAVAQGKLTAYDAHTETLTLWRLVGTLSTLSNGYFSVFTGPMWIIGGSLAGGAQSRAPERKSPPLGSQGLAAFARFPQGLPAEVDFGALEPK